MPLHHPQRLLPLLLLLLLLHDGDVWASEAIVVINTLRTDARVTWVSSQQMDAFLPKHGSAEATQEERELCVKEARRVAHTHVLAPITDAARREAAVFEVRIPVEERDGSFACACWFQVMLPAENVRRRKSVLLYNAADPRFRSMEKEGEMIWLICEMGLVASTDPTRPVIDWKDESPPTSPLLPNYLHPHLPNPHEYPPSTPIPTTASLSCDVYAMHDPTTHIHPQPYQTMLPQSPWNPHPHQNTLPQFAWMPIQIHPQPHQNTFPQFTHMPIEIHPLHPPSYQSIVPQSTWNPTKIHPPPHNRIYPFLGKPEASQTYHMPQLQCLSNARDNGCNTHVEEQVHSPRVP